MLRLLRSNLSFLIILALLPLANLAAHQLDDYVFRMLMLVGINVILAVSLNLVNGITGQFSLGHAGFMAVGAYTSASVTYYLGRAFVQPWIAGMDAGFLSQFYLQGFFLGAILIGALSAAVLGFLVGVPSLRLRGDYLAIVTLGFGEIIRVFILNIEAVGGARGFADIPPFTTFYWVFGSMAFTLIIIDRLINSSHGRAFLAVREDEIAAESVGVSTTRYKVMAFVISSFFAGLAGGLFAHFQMYINPQSFTFLKSFEIITMVVLGGMGSLSGSVMSALVLTALPEALRPLSNFASDHFHKNIDFRMVIYSLLLVVLMLTRPNGLFGKRELWQFLRRRR